MILFGSLWLPWLSVRPNRLALGEAVGLPPIWQGTLGGATLLYLILAYLSAVLSHIPIKSKLSSVFSGVFLYTPALCASIIWGLGWWILGSIATETVSATGEWARAAAGSGFWIWILGSCLTMYASGHAASSVSDQATRVGRRLGWLFVLTLLPLANWNINWNTFHIMLGFNFLGIDFATGHLRHWSVMQEYAAQGERFWEELWRHLKLTSWALGVGVLLGWPLSVWAFNRPIGAAVVLGLARGIQTVPSLALLGLLIAPLAWLSETVPLLRSLGVRGIGETPALIAMTLYALLPITSNGIAGLKNIPREVRTAGIGMGMTHGQLFWQVLFPLALPVWLGGVRQAAVLLVGVASIAQLIGAGGLGYFIFSGLQNGATDLILLGALPAAGLALGLNGLLRALERALEHRLAVILGANVIGVKAIEEQKTK